MTVISGGITENSNNIIPLSIFDIAKDWSAELTSDITDYYVEDNTPVQDHIALKPKIVTISGYQGELVSRTEQSSTLGLTAIKQGQVIAGIMQNIKNANLQALAQKLDILNPLNPVLPPQVAQARAKISRAVNFADKYRSLIGQNIATAKRYANLGKNILDTVRDTELRNKGIVPYPESLQMDRQKYAYQKFQYLWVNKILCFVDTPWGTFKNMAIQSVAVSQDENTKHITDISITFKQINKTSPKYEQFNASMFKSAVASAQHSEMVEMGKTQGKQVPLESYWYKMLHGGQ